MKILLINPNSDPETATIMKKRADLFSQGRLQVDCVSLKNTSRLIASKKDWADALPEMRALIEEDRYDAYVVACHADPNLDLLKELSSKPVVGMAEASMKIASMAGNSFAVISPSPKSISNKIALARKYHCNDLFRGTEVAETPTYRDVLAAARRARERGDIDIIVLGCANYAGFDGAIEKELGIPVIDGVICGLALAESFVHYRQYKTHE